jgi:hypothetical protein
MNKGSFTKGFYFYLNNLKKNYNMGLLNLKRTNKKLFFISLWMNMSLCCLYQKNIFESRLQCRAEEKEFKIPPRVKLDELRERISVVQTAGNKPLEDSFILEPLTIMPGYMLAVLDGHGGPNVSYYASGRFLEAFEELYTEYAKPGLSSIDDKALIKALEMSFNKIVKMS